MAFGGWDCGRNAGQPQDNRGTTLRIKRDNHRTTRGQQPASARSAGEAEKEEEGIANTAQPPHWQLTAHLVVLGTTGTPEIYKKNLLKQIIFANLPAQDHGRLRRPPRASPDAPQTLLGRT